MYLTESNMQYVKSKCPKVKMNIGLLIKFSQRKPNKQALMNCSIRIYTFRLNLAFEIKPKSKYGPVTKHSAKLPCGLRIHWYIE